VRKQKNRFVAYKKALNVLSINDFKPKRKTTRPKKKQMSDVVDKASALPKFFGTLCKIFSHSYLELL
jgi:hypothetical protein